MASSHIVLFAGAIFGDQESTSQLCDEWSWWKCLSRCSKSACHEPPPSYQPSGKCAQGWWSKIPGTEGWAMDLTLGSRQRGLGIFIHHLNYFVRPITSIHCKSRGFGSPLYLQSVRVSQQPPTPCKHWESYRVLTVGWFPGSGSTHHEGFGGCPSHHTLLEAPHRSLVMVQDGNPGKLEKWNVLYPEWSTSAFTWRMCLQPVPGDLER